MAIIPCNQSKYYLSDRLISQLNIISRMVRNDNFDGCILIDGEIEGSGKSVLAQQVAYYWDNTLDVDKIVFNPLDFINCLKNADKYQAIIWDEAFEGTSSQRTLSKVNFIITKTLMAVRQKNLFIIIVLPHFTDLNKYVAIRRSWFLLRAELKANIKEQKLQRGYFSFFARDLKKLLYFQEKKQEYSLKTPNIRPNFIGRFGDYYTINKSLYLDKKAKSLFNSADFEKIQEELELENNVKEFTEKYVKPKSSNDSI